MSQHAELRRLLVIGGSDSSGGAGIQADIKTGAALGVDVATAIAAITAQNSLGVHAIDPVTPAMLRAQIASVCSDIPPHAVKLGMLCDAARVSVVADAIRSYELRNVVCDPALVSTSGAPLLDARGSRRLLTLLPFFTLITPNLMEAAALTGMCVRDSASLLEAGRTLLDRGANAVLLKGGHLDGDECVDVLLQKRCIDPIYLPSPRVETRNDHGTGCVLASAIASGLARGLELVAAVKSGCAFVQAALQRSASLWTGAGRGSMNLLDEKLE